MATYDLTKTQAMQQALRGVHIQHSYIPIVRSMLKFCSTADEMKQKIVELRRNQPTWFMER